MNTVTVIAHFDLDCEWEGLPPAYRVYLADELFAERTWIWTDCYLSEMLQISAPPGRYALRVEPVGPTLAQFTVTNQRVAHGPATWTKKGRVLEIQDESAGIPT